MTIKLSSLPPEGDLIRATANVQGLQKGNYYYYVVDIAKKEVIAAGGDKLPDDALFTDLVQTDFSDGDTGFPISKGAVRGEMGLKGVAYKDTLSHKNIAGNDQPNAHPMSSVNGVVHVLPSLLDKDLSNLDDPKEARDNLGLGSASVKSVGDFAGYQDASIQGCSDGDVRGLVYEQFLAPMVKAVQEQQAMIEAQQATADRQDADIAELRSMLQGS